MESVLLQVRLAMSSTDPRPAQLEHGRGGDYGIHEAIDAYIRACQVHGWNVPANFREQALGGASASGW
jgi:ubiquitin-conjugating enzyme E2 Q